MSRVIPFFILAVANLASAFLPSRSAWASLKALKMTVTDTPITNIPDTVYAKGTPMERPKIGNSILDVIGATPIIRLNRLNSNSYANIFLKLESMEVTVPLKRNDLSSVRLCLCRCIIHSHATV